MVQKTSSPIFQIFILFCIFLFGVSKKDQCASDDKNCADNDSELENSVKLYLEELNKIVPGTNKEDTDAAELAELVMKNLMDKLEDSQDKNFKVLVDFVSPFVSLVRNQ